MGCFDGILLCSDCDGTLMNHNGDISDKNCESIRYFQAHGGTFTLCTGRSPDHIRHYRDQITLNAPMISLGGGVIATDNGQRILWDMPLKETAMADALNLFNDMPVFASIHACTAQNRYAITRSKTAFDPMLPDEKLYKFVYVSGNGALTTEDRRQINDRFASRYRLEQSWSEGIELMPLAGGKFNAAAHLKTLLPGIHTLVCVGDYENDISMLRGADLGIAVQNALPAAKDAADIVLSADCDHDPFCEILSSLEQLSR